LTIEENQKKNIVKRLIKLVPIIIYYSAIQL
jgi:hypothetical protein